MDTTASLPSPGRAPWAPQPSHRRRVSGRAATLGLAAGLVGLGAYSALATPMSGDYSPSGAVAGDNAAPALAALAHGDLGGFVAHQPIMGLTSLVLRAPMTWAAAHVGGGALTAYRLGALACLLPAIALAVWILTRAAPARWGLPASAIAAVSIVAGPATVSAIHVGHPEEVLAITLSTAAVLAALRGRVGWSAVLLGLAIGTKQWAVIAAPSVFLALPAARRVAAGCVCTGIAGVLCAALPLTDPAAFGRADAAVSGLSFADPFSVWWRLSPVRLPGTGVGGIVAHTLPHGISRSTAAAAAAVIAVSALWLYSQSRARRGPSGHLDAMALLALAGLLRCFVDPAPLQYNFADLVIPLAVWEAVVLTRIPVLTLLTWVPAGLLLSLTAFTRMSSGYVNAVSIIWMVALGVHLTRRALGAPAPGDAPARRRLRGIVASRLT